MLRRPIESKPEQKPVSLLEVGISFDSANEQVIISAACLSAELRRGLTQRLNPEAFIVEKHKVIWEGLTEIARKDLDYEPHTLYQVTSGKADVEYVQNLIKGYDKPPNNLKYHAELLLWDKARIECARGPLSTFIQLLKDPVAPADKVKNAAREVFYSLDANAHKNRAIDSNELMRSSNELLDKFKGNYYSFGIEGLDYFEDGRKRFNPGAAPKMTTVVTAISGGGKSTFIAQLALAQGPGIKSTNNSGLGRQILYGSWEMEANMLLNLMACMSLGWSRDKALTGDLTREERIRLDEEKHHISKFIKFKGQPKTTKSTRYPNEEALSSIYGIISDNACEVAVFDLWERAFSFRFEYEEKACLIRQQEIAKELGVHQILAAQARLKDLEQRTDKRPTREGIKGSSGWIDIADTIIGANLPHLWKNIAHDRMEILILKQRYAQWPLLVEADYDEPTGLISNCRSATLSSKIGSELDEFEFLNCKKD